jgi:hypothetical protein
MKFENIFGVLTSKEQEDRLYTILNVFNLIFWILTLNDFSIWVTSRERSDLDGSI